MHRGGAAHAQYRLCARITERGKGGVCARVHTCKPAGNFCKTMPTFTKPCPFSGVSFYMYSLYCVLRVIIVALFCNCYINLKFLFWGVGGVGISSSPPPPPPPP